MRMRGVVIAALASGCMSPVMHFGGGKSPEEAQHDRLTELMPPQLAAQAQWTGEVRTAKIRVWADDDYRAQNVGWQHTFQEELDYANTVLAPMLGLRLDAEYHSWPHHAPGSPLADELQALAEADPGNGVFSVVGLTSSLSLVSATFDQIGYGSLPGRYLIVRGYAEVGERQAFEREFPKIGPDERDVVVEARRRHKTTAVLLHELGHNLGARHEDEPDTIMNAMYSDHSASFSERSRTVMLASLAGRLGRPVEVAKALTPQARHPTMIITITASGEALVGGRVVDDETLGELFRMSFADDRDTEVVVKAARAAPHGVVVKVFDRAKTAGLHRMSIDASDRP